MQLIVRHVSQLIQLLAKSVGVLAGYLLPAEFQCEVRREEGREEGGQQRDLRLKVR